MSAFSTDEVFKSREDMMEWVQNTARTLGYVIVTKRSKTKPSGSSKVILMCDRGGVYRLVKRTSKATGTKKTGTKKTNCPFELMGRYTKENASWKLYVICDKHNHPPAQHMEGHPFLERLSHDEFQLLTELTKKHVAPRDILGIIKEQNEDNVSRLKTIYNARNKIRQIDRKGKTPMQVLMSHLYEKGYISYTSINSFTNELESLFFAHRTSVNLLRAFPHVMLMDATYKTNKYDMPFFQIVGVTSTNKTFSIAFAFMHKETTEIYIWVLKCLKSILDKCMQPRVIVTDRELALMNACQQVFPNANRLLCRFHISQSIFRNCKSSFKSKRKWEDFNRKWSLLIESQTLTSFMKNYKELELQSMLIKFPGVLHYLNSTRSTLDKFVGRIDEIVKSQYTSIKASFEKSKTILMHEHNLPTLKLLHGHVAHEALDILVEELKLDPSNCGCQVRKSCGVPCACVASMHLKEDTCIPLDSIDIFWRKLDMSPLTHEENDDIACDVELKMFQQLFNKQSKPGKKILLAKLKGIIDPSIPSFEEPAVQKNTRGRPSSKKQKKSQVDPQRSHKHSRSTKPNVVEHSSCVNDSNPLTKETIVQKNTRGRPSLKKRQLKSQADPQYPRKRSCSTKPSVVEYNFMDLKPSPPRQSSYANDSEPLMKEIPDIFHPYITSVQDVNSDGHCGFRSIAICLGLNEDRWPEIRRELIDELSQGQYRHVFGTDYDDMYESLYFVGTGYAPGRKWMIMPDTAVLIANRFGVLFHFLSKKGSSTCFPLWQGPEDFQDHRALTIAYVHGNHYVMVRLEGEYPMPPTMGLWNQYKHSDAISWTLRYKRRLDMFVKSVACSSSVVIDD